MMDEPVPIKLDNSLIEMCVVVGMDQDTGLQLPAYSKEKVPPGSNSKDLPIFKSFYKPFVLAALSGETAVFTHTTCEVDGSPFYASDSVTTQTPVKNGKTPRRRVSACIGVGGAMLPISAEVITSLPPLCLPDGGQVFDGPRNSVVHYLVLTDIEGTRTYCCCLRIYKPYLAKENENIPGQYDLVFSNPDCDEEAAEDSSFITCYAPLCCCIISKYPYFGIFKDCLSSMVSNLYEEPRKFRSGLMQFISQLAMVPIPPPGSLAVEFNLSGITHTVRPNDEPEKRIIDIELHYPFLCFSVDDILLLMSCVLTQQRLVFISSKYAMLTLIIESIFSFIQPLSWSWTYVPVLPNNLVDMTEAPGVYILGCHTSLQPQIERAMYMHEMADLIIANIDEGKIKLGENVNLQKIPSRVADPFKARMKDVSPLFDLKILNRPSFLNVHDMKKERDRFALEFNNAVLSASLEMMARILSDMSTHQETSYQGENFFDLAAFIESKAEEDQEFYKELCKTHAFSSFLEDRLQRPEKRDYFTAVMDKMKPQQNRGPLRKRSSSVNPKTSSSASFDEESKESPPMSKFSLPPFTFEGIFKGSFYDVCLAELTTTLENLDNKSSHLMANYLYLRGMLKVARGNRLDGLDDLFALSTRNMQLFPKSYIGQLLSQLTPAEQEELHTKGFYGEASRIKNLKQETDYLNRNRVRVTTSAVPSSPLDQAEFVKRVTMLQITDSSQTAEKLFEVLRNKMNRLVDPDVFSNFYRSLQEADRTAQSIKLTGIIAEHGESVVLASSWLRTATANGRLIATTNRLVFINEGTHKCDTVMRYEDIKDVENYQYYVVIPPGVASLKITSRCKASTPFIACLKDDRAFWNECIREMVAGYRIAQETKDHQTIKQASQNVIIADALRGSDHMDSIGKVLYLKDIQDAEIEAKKLSEETKRMLIRRIDPTPQADETQKTTIEAMVFAPESKENCNEAEVWCGLGSGAVVVIDTIAWNIVTVLRYARSRVSCLEAVGKNHIWVGSMDATIYIINRKTKQADQQLHSHHDYISHIIKTEEDDGTLTVWSASLEGLIIGWDPVTLTPKKTIKLKNVKTMTSVVAIGNAFWCVTRNAVLVVDKNSDGSDYKTLTCKAKNDIARSIDCMCAIEDDSEVHHVWTACDKKGIIASWDTSSYSYEEHEIPCKGFTQLLFFDGKVWGGGRDGTIYIINAQDATIEQALQLHKDRIRSMCPTDTSFILTGPGSSDGRIAVWRTHLLEMPDNSDGFEFVEKNIVRLNSRKTSSKRK